MELCAFLTVLLDDSLAERQTPPPVLDPLTSGKVTVVFSVGPFFFFEMSLLNAERGSVRKIQSQYRVMKSTFHCCSNTKVRATNDASWKV